MTTTRGPPVRELVPERDVPRRPFRTRFDYTDFLQLPLAYSPNVRKILFIGLGAGSAQKRMWRDFPELELETVELDPVVRDVAYRYFRCRATRGCR